MLEKKNFYINGEWVASKNQKDIEVINPANSKVCAIISLGSKEDVNEARNGDGRKEVNNKILSKSTHFSINNLHR